MEEERIASLRNEMWICSNIVSQTSVDVDVVSVLTQYNLVLLDQLNKGVGVSLVALLFTKLTRAVAFSVALL